MNDQTRNAVVSDGVVSFPPMGSDPRSVAGRPTNLADLLGQVATPLNIATRMTRQLLVDRPSGPIRVLDPCTGPGTFTTALAREQLMRPDDTLVGFDIDPTMILEASRAAPTLPNQFYQLADYLLTDIAQVDYAIMNPPYIRQEWIDHKHRYRERIAAAVGSAPPGTANLYTYFMVKALSDLKPNGRFAFIVYDSWQYTRFGEWLRGILAAMCKDLKIEVVRQQPFHGRLIDATILYGSRASGHSDRMMHLRREPTRTLSPGWTTIQNAFDTRRGLRLKQASFFRCRLEDCDTLGGTPFLKKVGKVTGFSIPSNHPDAAILIREPNTNEQGEAALLERLERAHENPDANVTILNWHAKRPDVWQYHRPAPHAPIVFNYYLRNRPRHLHNPERPYSDNFYGLIPHSGMDTLAWLAVLNSTTVTQAILARSRNQGNGLAKIQLYEYRDVVIPDLETFDGLHKARLTELGGLLTSADTQNAQETFDLIDSALHDALGVPFDPTSPAFTTQGATKGT